MPENPYQTPAQPSASPTPQAAPAGADVERSEDEPAISPAETITARYAAFFLDNVLALFATYFLAKSISDQYPVLQVVVFASTYFLYFFVLEALTGRTVGKALVGLVVIRFDGRPIGWRQALVRTLLRLFEVNPVLLGGLPAAIAVLSSPARQRIGDRLAGTIVVRSWRWRRFRKSAKAQA